jgi:hypothetical protein
MRVAGTGVRHQCDFQTESQIALMIASCKSAGAYQMCDHAAVHACDAPASQPTGSRLGQGPGRPIATETSLRLGESAHQIKG